jgi:hypothetical protein
MLKGGCQERKWPRRCGKHPGTRPTEERVATVDTKSISPAGDGFYAAAKHRSDHDDTVETHYAALERPHECPLCFRGYVTITLEEDGQEHHEAVPCKRCIS